MALEGKPVKLPPPLSSSVVLRFSGRSVAHGLDDGGRLRLAGLRDKLGLSADASFAVVHNCDFELWLLASNAPDDRMPLTPGHLFDVEVCVRARACV